MTLVNHNRLLRDLEGCIGVKTGYTKVCGRCLVSAVERDGITLICVTLNCSDDWNKHKILYDKNFPRCSRTLLVKSKEIYLPISVAGGHNVGCYCDDIYGVIIDGKSDFTVRTTLPKFIYADKRVGDIVGNVKVFCGEVIIAESPLILDRDTQLVKKRTSFFTKLFEFILHLLGF